MIWTTHIKIASLIHYNIEVYEGISLHKQGFIYGNIKPDIKADYRAGANPKRIEHFVDTSLDFVVKKLAALLAKLDDDRFMQSRDFAIELGHITHYFSDYFCCAHSLYFDKSLREHLVYEFKFATYFDAIHQLFPGHHQCVDGPIHKNLQTIMTAFHQMQHKYLANQPSFYNDACFTMIFNTMLCRSIILLGKERAQSIKLSA